MRILFYCFVVAIFLFSGLFFLYVPVTITGSDNSILRNGQTYFYEKVTYLFKSPKVGDLVTFNPAKYPDQEYIGVISKITNASEVTSYTIVNKLNSANPWIVSRDKIVGHVYFPIFTSPVSLN